MSLSHAFSLLGFTDNNEYAYMDETSINDYLKCRICKKPFVDPVSNTNGDTFCRKCLTEFLRQNPSTRSGSISPENGQILGKMQSYKSVTEPIVLQMLNDLLVRCPKCYKTNIKRGQLEEHKNQSCPKATVLCTAADIKCNWMGTREELDQHADGCRFQPLRSAFQSLFDEQNELKTRLDQLEDLLNISKTDSNDE